MQKRRRRGEEEVEERSAMRNRKLMLADRRDNSFQERGPGCHTSVGKVFVEHLDIS
jgi:hypothetical protein